MIEMRILLNSDWLVRLRVEGYVMRLGWALLRGLTPEYYSINVISKYHTIVPRL